MKRFIWFIAIIMCVVFVSCQLATVEEKVEVSATITEMEYKASYVYFLPTYNSATKTTTIISQPHPAQYLVTITYENITQTFDDKDLYESVQKGDTIQIILCNYYDKDNNLLEQELKLPE